MRYRADSEVFDVIKIFGQAALFSCSRIEQGSVPKGLYQYEVRHDDCCQGIPCEVAKGIMVNFWGTVLTGEAIAEVEACNYRYILEGEWEEKGTNCTLKEWLEGEKDE